MIDSHCHLAGEEFVAELDAVVCRAREAGVERALVILAADSEAEVARAPVVARAWPGIGFAVGVHPHAAAAFADDPARAGDVVSARLDQTGARAIGEIGLDYHYDFAPPEAQEAVFRAQLRVARERRLPVVLHVREAEDATLRILAEECDAASRGVFHCFTGDADAAARALATGFHLSVPGIVTFPKAEALRAAVAGIPVERLLIETDSPYLAPVPFRGRRNEPAFVARVLDTVAAVRGDDRAALAARLVETFDDLFPS